MHSSFNCGLDTCILQLESYLYASFRSHPVVIIMRLKSAYHQIHSLLERERIQCHSRYYYSETDLKLYARIGDRDVLFLLSWHGLIASRFLYTPLYIFRIVALLEY